MLTLSLGQFILYYIAYGGYTAVSGNYIKMELQSDPRNRDAAGRIAGVRMIHAGREGNLGVLD